MTLARSRGRRRSGGDHGGELPSAPARAQEAGSASWIPQVLGTQATVIAQRLAPFSARYSGALSLAASGDRAVSDRYGVYTGARFARARVRLDAYLDVEMSRGRGISHATGLAGVTSGDVPQQDTAELLTGPYVARASLRYTVGSGAVVDAVGRAVDQLAGVVARHRLEISAGKPAASDLFDQNHYANSTRTQFLDWGVFQNMALDCAVDTRGYANGVMQAWSS